LQSSSLEVRSPAVAGYFYPLDRSQLLRAIGGAFGNEKIGPGVRFPENLKKEVPQENDPKFYSYIVPHAGYEYSGPVAAHSYLQIAKKVRIDSQRLTVIILGPNHNGIGSGVALSPSKKWSTPLGNVNVNTDFSEKLSAASDIIDVDAHAHSQEHSIEVQLPFLIAISGAQTPSFRIVPVSLMLQDSETSKDLASAISEVMSSPEQSRETFLLLASSDLTHYEPQKTASEKDSKLIEKICSLDTGSYYSVLERYNVTACGYGAIATAMQVCKSLERATKPALLKYATSGDVTGDYSSVVGYPAVQLA
jgi:MEMO1 family protein